MSDSLQSQEYQETVGLAIARLRQSLAGSSGSAALDAQVLVAKVLGRERAWVLAHPEHHIRHDQQMELLTAERELLDGIPLPYVLGEWEFYKLPFYINPHVLIPRPETELLVEVALGWMQMRAKEVRMIDVGTGSGCLAAAIAVNYRGAAILAGDISPEAIAVARANFIRHRVYGRVGLVQMDLLEGLPGRCDLIVSNPPYIPSERLAALPVAKHEPRRALDGGTDGLNHIRRLLAIAPRCLASKGMLLVEIEADQGMAVMELARAHFPLSDIAVMPDLAGKDRLLRVEN